MKRLKNILLEGRVEDARQYLETFVGETGYLKTEEDVDEVLGYFVAGDPSGNNKYLMWMAKIYANDSGFSPNMLTDYVQRFHNNLDKIHPALIANMGFYSGSRLATSPKNIDSYNEYRTLKKVVDAAEESVTRKQREKEAKEGVDKLYEDNRWLLVKPNTYEGSCYYGSSTKWCTSSRDAPQHFESYSKTGNLFYIIDKSKNVGDFFKIALHKDWNGQEKWYDRADNELEEETEKAIRSLLPTELVNSLEEEHGETPIPETPKFTYAEFAHELRNFVNNLGKSIKLKTKSGIWDLEITVNGLWVWNSDDPRVEVVANPFPDGEPVLDIYLEIGGTSTTDTSAFTPEESTELSYKLDVDHGIEVLRNYNFGPEDYLQRDPPENYQNGLSNVEGNLKRFLMLIYAPKVREILDSDALTEFMDGDYETWESESYVSSYQFNYPPRKGTMTQLFVNYIKQNPKSTAMEFYQDVYGYPRPKSHNNMFFSSIKDSGIVKMERRGRQFVYSIGPNYSAWTKGKLLRTNKKYGQL